jgi:hypothetical protein
MSEPTKQDYSDKDRLDWLENNEAQGVAMKAAWIASRKAKEQQ